MFVIITTTNIKRRLIPKL